MNLDPEKEEEIEAFKEKQISRLLKDLAYSPPEVQIIHVRRRMEELANYVVKTISREENDNSRPIL